MTEKALGHRTYFCVHRRGLEIDVVSGDTLEVRVLELKPKKRDSP